MDKNNRSAVSNVGLFKPKYDSKVSQSVVTGKALARNGKCLPIRFIDTNCFPVLEKKRNVLSVQRYRRLPMAPVSTLPEALVSGQL